MADFMDGYDGAISADEIEITRINANEKIGFELIFTERGNGYPETGDIIIDHAAEVAYRVLPGAGNILTGNAMAGDPNECTLNVMILDYDEYADHENVWEI